MLWAIKNKNNEIKITPIKKCTQKISKVIYKLTTNQFKKPKYYTSTLSNLHNIVLVAASDQVEENIIFSDWNPPTITVKRTDDFKTTEQMFTKHSLQIKETASR